MNMNNRGLGSLSDLAKILEEASNPESIVREDRQPKPKVAHRKGLVVKQAKAIDPKRKAWHDRRLKEQAAKANATASSTPPPPEPIIKPANTKAVASGLTSSLLSTLAAARTAKPKEEGNKRSEAWKRKPGESVF
jgi:hypothetical protein